MSHLCYPQAQSAPLSNRISLIESLPYSLGLSIAVVTSDMPALPDGRRLVYHNGGVQILR